MHATHNTFLFLNYRALSVSLETWELVKINLPNIDSAGASPFNVSEENATMVCSTSHLSELDVAVKKSTVTFLLSTTVCTFAIIGAGVTSAIVYCLCCKDKKFSKWIGGKQKKSMKIGKRTKKGTKCTGYCEHCKGRCCQLPIINQKSLVRRGNDGSIDMGTKYASKLTNAGTWRSSVTTIKKPSDYNLGGSGTTYLQ